MFICCRKMHYDVAKGVLLSDCKDHVMFVPLPWFNIAASSEVSLSP